MGLAIPPRGQGSNAPKEFFLTTWPIQPANLCSFYSF